jgi:hypothetical protein
MAEIFPGLARVMQQKYRCEADKLLGRNNKRKEREDAQHAEEKPKQPRKKQKLMAVIRDRFYPDSIGEPDRLLRDLESITGEDDPQSREQIYSQHRNAMQHLFLSSSTITSCVPGFLTILSTLACISNI